MIYEDFFSDRLMTLREQKNVSAREMSLAIGQNGSYINRIENHQAFPSMRSFFYICEYLDISPKDFFNEQTDNPVLISEIMEQLLEMDEEQLNTILAVSRGLNHK